MIRSRGIDFLPQFLLSDVAYNREVFLNWKGAFVKQYNYSLGEVLPLFEVISCRHIDDK